MGNIKLTSWNIAHLDRLTKEHLSETERRRREAIIREIRELDPDVLCLLEGPAKEAGIDQVTEDMLGGDWQAVKLLDHILFTQGLVDGSLPWEVKAHAGKVEHEIHDLINAALPERAHTSDHKPVSVQVAVRD